jgi:dTDP-4-dehydrorhamnose reductase
MIHATQTPAPDGILILGANGQLGHELCQAFAGENVTAWDHAACDFSDPARLRAQLAHWTQTARPRVILNAAAYTAVDRAESEPNLAFHVNGDAPGILGEIAAACGALLVHYSTDYVFDGQGRRPYREDDMTNPLSVYGKSKRAGEIALQSTNARYLILRTSWVFGAHGGNFLKTMLRLFSERDTLSVVSDQIGAPTSAAWLAAVTATLARRYQEAGSTFPAGLYHLAAAGEVSWHGYARYLFDLAKAAGMPIRLQPEGLQAITSRDYPTPAARPANSCLDCQRLADTFGITPPPWQDGVTSVFQQIFPSSADMPGLRQA